MAPPCLHERQRCRRRCPDRRDVFRRRQAGPLTAMYVPRRRRRWGNLSLLLTAKHEKRGGRDRKEGVSRG